MVGRILRTCEAVWCGANGLVNWRLRSERRHIDQNLLDECLFQSQWQTKALGISSTTRSSLYDRSNAGTGAISEAICQMRQICLSLGPKRQRAVVEVNQPTVSRHPDGVRCRPCRYFGTIPHAELIKSVARRIVDRRVTASDYDVGLECVQWHRHPTIKQGRRHAQRGQKISGCGISHRVHPISPLLSKSVYAGDLYCGWKKLGLDRTFFAVRFDLCR